MPINRSGTSRNIILISIIMLAVVFVGLFVHNMMKRSKYNAVIDSIYEYRARVLAKQAKKETPDIDVVLNSGFGERQNDGNYTVKLIKELEIGYSLDDSVFHFNKVFLTCSDKYGTIYVSDYQSGEVLKYDKNGNFLAKFGGLGAGPEEFALLTALRPGSDSTLIFYDESRRRVGTIRYDGSLINSFNIDNVAENGVCIILHDNKHFYLATYNRKTETLVHKYTVDGKHISSFGTAVPMLKNTPIPADNMILKNIQSGHLLIVDNTIYFARSSPYEIQQFTLDGKLKKRIFREHSRFFPAYWNPVRIEGERGFTFLYPSLVTAIGLIDEKIVVWVYRDRRYNNQQYKYPGSIVDIYDLDGTLEKSVHLDAAVNVSQIKSTGEIYGIELSENFMPIVVRYKLLISASSHN